MSIRVAVDAMGGDHAPEVVVRGALSALSRREDIQVILFGPESTISPYVNEMAEPGAPRPAIFDAPDVITMADSPSIALKTKKDSSIHRGLVACSEGFADAFISAGNTGAVMAAALIILGRQAGVKRPSLIGYFPTIKGHCILLDVGANVDCKPTHLLQFAHMGAVYAERVMHRGQPTVALLNIGEEPGKGNDQAKAAHKLLGKAPNLNFVGNIEGRDMLMHAADVVVSDGFVGNILLKFGESVASILPQMIGAEMQKLKMDEKDQGTVGRALKGVRARFDYQEYGGAPLLGVNGNVIIGHGGSNERAIENIIMNAAEMVREDVSASISAALAG
jgi:glycerol-3-phosphate acyltransferase PlsX